jgi:hypothetical protein
MSQTRNTGFLTNIIQYTPSGSINFVSGSTTLMSISSSGAITTTGVISGSNAATASSVANLTQNVQITGSLGVTSTITAQTLVVQTVTSSIVYSSGSNTFGNSQSNVQQFTGSVSVTGSIFQTGTNVTASFSGLSGFGTTTPRYAVDVQTSSGVGSSVATGSGLIRAITAGTGDGILVGQADSGRSVGIGANQFKVYGDDYAIMTTGASPLYLATSGSTRLTVSSAGNVGIGTSSPTQILDVNGPRVRMGDGGGFELNFNATYCAFQIALTERMRITSDGNVLIGGNTVANLGTSNRIGAFRVDSAGEVYLQLATTGQSTVNHAFFYNSTGLGGSIRTSSGTISLVNGSDYRMKTNIESLTEGLSIISKLKPCTFEYIATEGSKFEGFIAHELQEIIPNAVFGEKDAINEDGTPDYQGVDTVKIIPYLVKAIQELKAENDSLKEILQRNNIQ